MNKLKYIWIIIFLVGLGLRSTYVLHPIDTLSWRESDEAAIAKNYYENHMHFFHPQINWGGTGPGFAEMEFPVYPYLIALSYKVFGFHESVGRIIALIFSLAAMLVFFRLSRLLFDKRTAIIVSFFFAISPLSIVVSDTIQPESIMFFFYVCAAYTFIRWLEDESYKNLLLTAFCTAFALLSKITAGHIGILFLLLILTKKNWKFLFNYRLILFGTLSLVPSMLWYNYSHQFYINYGNSLGLSNEYAWVGLDFFTDPSFFLGIIKNEIHYVWMSYGLVIVLLAIFLTTLVKTSNFKLAFFWIVAVFIFYVIASRTTSENWAYYYHIFSVPAASILLGISIAALYEKYFQYLKFEFVNLSNLVPFLTNMIVPLLLIVLLFLQIAYSFRSTYRKKNEVFQTSEYYLSRNKLSEIITNKPLILASGFICADSKGYPKAYNSSYFFYWLNKKGYNICIGEQTIENVKTFSEKGASYFIAEKSALKQKNGFEEELNKNYISLYNDDGLIVYKLK